MDWIDLEKPVKKKALKNKSINRLCKLWDITNCNWSQDLQFESLDMETKKYFYRAIDNLKAFIDNID